MHDVLIDRYSYNYIAIVFIGQFKTVNDFTVLGMPEIQDISMSAANEEVRFTVSAVGTPSNKYTWIRNGDVLDNSDDGVQINPSPPVLRLDSVHSGDIITVEASNTNIHGETSSDRVLVFVFTLASSSEPGGMSSNQCYYNDHMIRKYVHVENHHFFMIIIISVLYKLP